MHGYLNCLRLDLDFFFFLYIYTVKEQQCLIFFHFVKSIKFLSSWNILLYNTYNIISSFDIMCCYIILEFFKQFITFIHGKANPNIQYTDTLKPANYTRYSEIKQSVKMHFCWFCQKWSTVMHLNLHVCFECFSFCSEFIRMNQTGVFKWWFNLNHLNWYWSVPSPGNEFLRGGMSTHYVWILCLEVYYMFIMRINKRDSPRNGRYWLACRTVEV